MAVLSCSECLARHSEYLDGVMDAASSALWRAHLENCPDCARYDRVLRRGIAHLAAQPPAELTPDFTMQLQHRLAFEERRMALRPITSMATASLMVAAMLAFAAWIPVLMLARSDSDSAGQVAVLASASQVATEIAWHAEDAVDHGLPAHVHQAARRVLSLPSHRGPMIEPAYTPIVLESPIAPLTYARTVSFGAD
jgi:predicted anti-sigma-YlaC factor YlaD